MTSPGMPASDSPTPITPLSARAAYNLVAHEYDAWYWQEFWHRNEAPLVRAALRKGDATRRAIDIGTGTGFYASTAAALGYSSTGIDLSENMLDVARASFGLRIQLAQADAAALPFPRGCFDVAIAARIYSHVRELQQALGEAARVLKIGGLLVITDVDSAHDYRATRLALGDSMIYIDTYKHTVAQIITAAHAVGFAFKRGRRLTARNIVWLPDSDEFKSIDRTGSRPIANVLIFRRVRASRSFAIKYQA